MTIPFWIEIYFLRLRIFCHCKHTRAPKLSSSIFTNLPSLASYKIITKFPQTSVKLEIKDCRTSITLTAVDANDEHSHIDQSDRAQK